MKKMFCMIIVLMVTVQYANAMDNAQQLAVLEISLMSLRKKLPPSFEFTPEQIEHAKKKLEQNPEALFGACRAGDFEEVRLLLAAGADVNGQDFMGFTPLLEAVSKGHLEIVRLLIEKGADVNKQDGDGYTPLHEAASHGYTEIVKSLIEANADVNKKTIKEQTPLDLASSDDIIHILLAHGAQPGKP